MIGALRVVVAMLQAAVQYRDDNPPAAARFLWSAYSWLDWARKHPEKLVREVPR